MQEAGESPASLFLWVRSARPGGKGSAPCARSPHSPHPLKSCVGGLRSTPEILRAPPHLPSPRMTTRGRHLPAFLFHGEERTWPGGKACAASGRSPHSPSAWKVASVAFGGRQRFFGLPTTLLPRPPLRMTTRAIARLVR